MQGGDGVCVYRYGHTMNISIHSLSHTHIHTQIDMLPYLGVDVGLLEDDAHGGAGGGVDAGEGGVLGVVPLHVLGVVLEDARSDGVPDALGVCGERGGGMDGYMYVCVCVCVCVWG